MKYSVGKNMPGFMPDSEPNESDNLDHAKECLAEDITHYLEDLNLSSEFTTDQVREFSSTFAKFDAAQPQVCNVYIGHYVFWITEN